MIGSLEGLDSWWHGSTRFKVQQPKKLQGFPFQKKGEVLKTNFQNVNMFFEIWRWRTGVKIESLYSLAKAFVINVLANLATKNELADHRKEMML